MTGKRRQQKDLFETPVILKAIPINTQPQLLELLKILLNEALVGDNDKVRNVSKEVGDDKDHA